jgi:hypothetical protein
MHSVTGQRLSEEQLSSNFDESVQLSSYSDESVGRSSSNGNFHQYLMKVVHFHHISKTRTPTLLIRATDLSLNIFSLNNNRG